MGGKLADLNLFPEVKRHDPSEIVCSPMFGWAIQWRYTNGAATTAGSMRIPNTAKRLNWRSAIGSRSLIGPRIRPEAAGGPPHQAPWTVHSPSSTLGGPFEIPMPIAVKGGVQDIEDKQLQLKREPL